MTQRREDAIDTISRVLKSTVTTPASRRAPCPSAGSALRFDVSFLRSLVRCLLARMGFAEERLLTRLRLTG